MSWYLPTQWLLSSTPQTVSVDVLCHRALTGTAVEQVSGFGGTRLIWLQGHLVIFQKEIIIWFRNSYIFFSQVILKETSLCLYALWIMCIADVVRCWMKWMHRVKLEYFTHDAINNKIKQTLNECWVLNFYHLQKSTQSSWQKPEILLQRVRTFITFFWVLE